MTGMSREMILLLEVVGIHHLDGEATFDVPGRGRDARPPPAVHGSAASAPIKKHLGDEFSAGLSFPGRALSSEFAHELGDGVIRMHRRGEGQQRRAEPECIGTVCCAGCSGRGGRISERRLGTRRGLDRVWAMFEWSGRPRGGVFY